MTKRIFIIASVIFCIAALPSMFIGCGGGKSDGVIDYPQTYDPSVSGPANIDAALILPVGQAWVDDYPAGERDGFSFAVDGTFRAVCDIGGVWSISGAGLSETSGDTLLTILSGWLYPGIDLGRSVEYTVSANNDTLTLTIGEQPEVFVRTSNINPTEFLAKRSAGGRKKR